MKVHLTRVPVVTSCIATFMACLLFTSAAWSQVPSKTVTRIDRASAQKMLRTLGYRSHSNVPRSKSQSSDPKYKSFPHFSSSFTVGSQTYPYTMAGYPPASGRMAKIRSVIVPLRMRFQFFGPGLDRDFDPTRAVNNILGSPLYQDAVFPNGTGQFGDMMQRAAFWNHMDPNHGWHLNMATPRVLPTVDIEVTPETGALLQISDDPNDLIGEVLFDFMDAQIKTILQLTKIDPDEVPIFVTDTVFNEALGYHDAADILNKDGSETLQTYIYTSWFDVNELGPLLADVSTFNHELMEWANDPFANNIVPTWKYPPETDPRAVCSGNPFLEVGDPQGNGPTFDDFPTVEVTLHGYTYHLQQLVLLQWFEDEVPSSALNGWYTFPDPTSLTAPAVYCP